MIYIRAGVFAEGRSDYDFLVPLLDRLLESLAAPLFPGAYEVDATMGIDAPQGMKGSRAEKIAAAIDTYWSACNLFVIHADGSSDPERAFSHAVAPGVQAAQAARPEERISAAACIPVREIEAWMLADLRVFQTILGKGASPDLPADPEGETDPKATLRRILAEGGARRAPERLYATFGENVSLAALRALPAFKAFEGAIEGALREIGQFQRA